MVEEAEPAVSQPRSTTRMPESGRSCGSVAASAITRAAIPANRQGRHAIRRHEAARPVLRVLQQFHGPYHRPDRHPPGLRGGGDLGAGAGGEPGAEQLLQRRAVGAACGAGGEALLVQARLADQVAQRRPVLLLVDQGDVAVFAGMVNQVSLACRARRACR